MHKREKWNFKETDLVVENITILIKINTILPLTKSQEKLESFSINKVLQDLREILMQEDQVMINIQIIATVQIIHN